MILIQKDTDFSIFYLVHSLISIGTLFSLFLIFSNSLFLSMAFALCFVYLKQKSYKSDKTLSELFYFHRKNIKAFFISETLDNLYISGKLLLVFIALSMYN